MTLRLKGSYSVSNAENPVRSFPFKAITCNIVYLDDKTELFRLEVSCSEKYISLTHLVLPSCPSVCIVEKQSRTGAA